MQLKFKISFVIVLCLLMDPCTRVSASPPDWFLKLPHKHYEIVGYGEGKTLEEARTKATKNIAQSIQTRILSESVFEEKLADRNYSQNARTRLQEKTDVVLSELTTVRKEYREGLWYLAVKVENLPFPKKMARRLGDYACKQQRQNPYLSGTPLIQALNAELGCRPDVRLIRNHGLWYLSCDHTMLALSARDFERLFVSYTSEDLFLGSTKTDLVEGDVFSLTLKPKRKGFLSLLNVYQNGMVSVLVANKPVESNEEVAFPDPSGDVELVAGLARDGGATFDLYVCLFSRRKIDVSRIQSAGSQVSRDETDFKFDEVLALMKKYTFCTEWIRTRPR